MLDADAGISSGLRIAGHVVTSHEHAGGLLNLRLALHGAPLVSLARELTKLDGVRVTSGPDTEGRERCYLVHCQGFKMVLSSSPDASGDAVALVSRSPQAALAILSELGATLGRLMSEPPPLADAKPAPWRRPAAENAPDTNGAAKPLRRSGLQQGAPLARKPLARKTELKRRTPLPRGRFDRS